VFFPFLRFLEPKLALVGHIHGSSPQKLGEGERPLQFEEEGIAAFFIGGNEDRYSSNGSDNLYVTRLIVLLLFAEN